MDLSEKRKQLEELRAARLKKQQLVDQMAPTTPPARPPVPSADSVKTAPIANARPSSPATSPRSPAGSTKTAQPLEVKQQNATRGAVAAPVPAPAVAKPGTEPLQPRSPRTPRGSAQPTFLSDTTKGPIIQKEEAPKTSQPPAPVTAHPLPVTTPAEPAAVKRSSPTVPPAPPSSSFSPSASASASLQTPGAASAPSPTASPSSRPSAATSATVASSKTAPLHAAVSDGRRQSSTTFTATVDPPVAAAAAGKRNAPARSAAAAPPSLPTTADVTTGPSVPVPAAAPPGAPQHDGFDVLHRWGALSDDTVLLPQCAPACAFSGSMLVGNKGRLIRSTAVTQLTYQPPGALRSERVPCVVAAYARPPFPFTTAATGGAGNGSGRPGLPPPRERAPSASELIVSASNSVGGLDHSLSTGGGGRVSPTNAAATSLGFGLAPIDEPEQDLAVRRATLTDTGYAWGTSAASRVHRFAGPSTHRMPGSLGVSGRDRGGLTGAALKHSMKRVAKDAPGLAIAWTVVVLHELDDGSVSDTLTVVTPLVCDSEIGCLAIDPLRPATLYGGLYCGRIVCWNLQDEWSTQSAKQLRTKALGSSGSDSTYLLRPRRPTLSSFPSPLAHQGPVLRLGVYGDLTSPQLYSVSQEGKVCTWSPMDPSMPTTSRSAYVGSRFLGSLASTAAFTTMRSTGAIMDVVFGTSTGGVFRGTSRDSRVLDLTALWQPRKSTSANAATATGERSGVVGGSSNGSRSSPDWSMRTGSASSPLAVSALNPFGSASISPESTRVGATGERSGMAAGLIPHTAMNSVMRTWGLGLGTATGGTTPPHLGIVTAVAVQPLALSASVNRDQNSSSAHTDHAERSDFHTGTGAARGVCVVSAATDGSCVAWVNQAAVPLSGFLSVVTCLEWSPTHPDVFAAGDAFGMVTLWNLKKSVTVPFASAMLGGPLATVRTEYTNSPVVPLHPGIKRGQRAADYLGQPLRGRIRESADGGADGVRAEPSSDSSDNDAFEDHATMTTDFITPSDGAVAISSLTFSRDGRWLFAGNASGMVYVLMLSKALQR